MLLKPIENLRIALRDLIIDMYGKVSGVEYVTDSDDCEVSERLANAFDTLDVVAQAFFGLSASELFDLYNDFDCDDCDTEDITDTKKTEA